MIDGIEYSFVIYMGICVKKYDKLIKQRKTCGFHPAERLINVSQA